MGRPASGTREWASHSANCVSGCEHGCLYCFANANARRFASHSGEWSHEVIRFPTRKIGRKRGVIMYPTTHDLTPRNADTTIPFLRSLLEAGNQVLVTTKPHPDVISRILRDLPTHRGQVMFRFTIGSLDSDVLARWEPFAPNAVSRLEAMAHANVEGWRVSVSAEPLLCSTPDEVGALLQTCIAFGGLEVWIGLLNHGERRLRANGHLTSENARMLADLEAAWTPDAVKNLVARYSYLPVVRWKESIKSIAGIPLREDSSEGEAWTAHLLDGREWREVPGSADPED